jgi:pimeloyl-ACP methyl ester carboxylesterase
LSNQAGLAARRRLLLTGLALVSLFGVFLSCPIVLFHWRAASLLLRVENPAAHRWWDFDTYRVDESNTALAGSNGEIPARYYRPRGVIHPAGLVILHGIHHLGIAEPRLMNFSRAFAREGVEVLTPELRSLAGYQVDDKDISVIGAAMQELRRTTGKQVGVLGLSFAGGLALLAAADPQYRNDVSFVAAVGAHDDLTRVSHYLATGQISRPDGTVQYLPPHEYGMLVLVYAHVDDFFRDADVHVAKEILRLHLWEQANAAEAHLAELSPAGRDRMELLLRHEQAALTPELLAMIAAHAAEMDELSPHGHLGSLHVPVYLLHGANDSVIPASESLWLAHDIPQPCVRELLISPLISHVEVGGKPSLLDQAELVHFVARLLQEIDRGR